MLRTKRQRSQAPNLQVILLAFLSKQAALHTQQCSLGILVTVVLMLHFTKDINVSRLASPQDFHVSFKYGYILAGTDDGINIFFDLLGSFDIGTHKHVEYCKGSKNMHFIRMRCQSSTRGPVELQRGTST